MADIFAGFKITSIQMRDFDTKEVLWVHKNWDFENTVEAHMPKKILSCKAVSREIIFSSQNEISDLTLIQEVKLHDQVIEEWTFDFGFVIPNSSNAWEQVIFASGPEELLPAEVLSGNLVIETTFLDRNEAIHRSAVRIFYD
jgi:retinal rod rhodopsin-sensitive cGMP 3',5'-cyclic phosphodiesterase subunit delta